MAQGEWLLLLTLTLLSARPVCSSEVVTTFSPDQPFELRNLARDSVTSNVYVGAVNRIFKLDDKLSLRGSLTTGPKDDSLDCPPDPSQRCCGPNDQTCGAIRRPTNCTNQALAVDQKNGVLIACSNLFYGTCIRINLASLSVEDEENYSPLISNDPEKPPFIFIQSDGHSSEGYLIVASPRSYKGQKVYTERVPLISTRSLDSFDLARSQSFIDLHLKSDSARPEITYKYAFGYKGFNFHVSVQYDEDDQSKLITKIARVCQGDDSYRSYVGLRLSCQAMNTDYNVLTSATVGRAGRHLADQLSLDDDNLYATFSSQHDSEKSAVCMYPMINVMRGLQQALEACFNGNNQFVRIGPSYLSQQGLNKCTRSPVDVSGRYCGVYDLNHPIESHRTPMEAFGTSFLHGHRPTAIKVKTVGNHTAFFIGTEEGLLLKVVQQNRSFGVIYEEFDVGIGPIQEHGMVFDANQNHIFMMSKSRVAKVRVSECSDFDSCQTCLAAQDPHCGWCFSRNKCAAQTECSDTENFTWFDIQSQCPLVTSVNPQQISFSSLQDIDVKLIVDKFPSSVVSGDVKCILEGTTPSQSVLAESQPSADPVGFTQVTCNRFSAITKLSDSQDHVQLAVKIQVKSALWANSSITLYNCSQLTTCMSCANTTLPCGWCINTHQCQPIEPSGCGGGVIVVHHERSKSRSSTGAARDLYGPELCPQIVMPNNVKRYLVSDELSKSFAVTGYNLQPVLESEEGHFQCRYTKTTQEMYSKAIVTERPGQIYDITCESRVFNYLENVASVKVPLNIVWNGKPIDNPESVHVVVYKCELLAEDCGHCLLLDEAYECGWCETGCSIEKKCAESRSRTQRRFMHRNGTCVNPLITDFQPLGGPVNGQTMLTIRGRNLGTKVSDVKGNVHLGTVLCEVIEQQYEPPDKIVCETNAETRAKNDTVSVRVAGRYSATSDKKYQYADPYLKGGFEPTRGPKSGGTRITIYGDRFHLGSVLTVRMDREELELLERKRSYVVVKTAAKDMASSNSKMTLSVDSVENGVEGAFSFVDDPQIESVSPDHSLLSGGTTLTVVGKNLDSVQQPYIQSTLSDGRTQRAPCKLMVASRMHCPTPNLGSLYSMTRRRREDVITYKPAPSFPLRVRYGFVMDGVLSVLNWNRWLTYYRDPVFHPFTSLVYYNADKELEILGEHLHVIEIFKKETMISVGGDSCQLSGQFMATRLTCSPPTNPRNMTKDKQASITVKLGNIEHLLGSMSYAGGAKVSTALILGVVLGLILPLVIICLLVFLYLRRRRQKRRNRNKTVMPPPNSVPNNYQQNRSNEQMDGATAEEAIPLKKSEEINLDDAPAGEKTNWHDLLSRIDNPKIRQAVADVMISKDRLELGELVGKGHFSCVYAGTLLDEGYENPSKVAVKTLQSNDFDRHSVENFLKEGVIMKNFNHCHVLQLLGVVVGPSNEPMVVLPYMANGDLRSYVKDKKKNFTARQLLSLGQQVAEGMAYLSSLNCVHRDLAARNCMIDEDNVVKVADFGLTRDLYERDYYSSKDRKAKLPIKWMALESLEDFVFTNKTDIWSYGVLLWELMTRGVTPYPDVDVFDIRTYLASGRRLRKPKYCPDNVYKIMLDCWHEIPERRPMFADLVNRLELLLNPPKKRQPQPEPSNGEPMYMNISKSDSAEYLNPVSPTSPSSPTSPTSPAVVET